MFQTIQCVNKPRGASGSSTIKTSDFASLGTPLIFSSGFAFAPLQVNFAGMSPPAWKAGVVTEMEEAAFILRMVPTKIARANEVDFIEQTLAAACRGQAPEQVCLVTRTRHGSVVRHDTHKRWHLACLGRRTSSPWYLSTRRHPGSISAEVRAGLANGWGPTSNKRSRWTTQGTTQPCLSMTGRRKPDLRAEILRLIRDPKYRPLDKIEIANALGYGAAQRNEVRRALRDLEQEGEIARIRKNRYVQPDAADLVTGTLSVHEAGYAFLTNEKPGQSDLFIAAENTGTAIHGDRVVARIIRGAEFSRARTPRAEGRVIRILTRANETIVGTLQQTRNFFYVVPDDPRLVHNIYVQTPMVTAGRRSQTARRDDKVVVRLEAWESRHVNPEGKIIEVLGPRSAPGVDILSIIRKYDLPVEFPKAVLEEASAIPETVTLLDRREDLRQQFIVTIDPDDA